MNIDKDIEKLHREGYSKLIKEFENKKEDLRALSWKVD